MKILMRAPQGPLDNMSPLDTCLTNSLWNNVGNLLFPNSMYRNLASENVAIDAYSKIKASDADYINENYDVFLIPLANAFRSRFVPSLNVLTELVEKLRIPCIVSGVGLQHDILKEGESASFPFDEAVSRFVKAISKKSAKIGVRGEATYNYLKRLGFSSIVDIIGCPSMFTFGENLPIPKELKCESDLRIAINGKGNDVDIVKQRLFGESDFFADNQNVTYIPQETKELLMMLCGVPVDSKEELFPLNLRHKYFMQEGKAKFFVNPYSWFAFMRENIDFSIGTRIHGNVAAVLSGTPACVVATDARVLELSEYHNIPHISLKEFEKADTVNDIYSSIDFKKVCEGHKERYANFKRFLRENGLNPVDDPNRYFDKVTADLDFEKPINSLLFEDKQLVVSRLGEYNSYLLKKDKERVERIEELKGKNRKLEEQISTLKDKNCAIIDENKKYRELYETVQRFF